MHFLENFDLNFYKNALKIPQNVLVRPQGLHPGMSTPSCYLPATPLFLRFTTFFLQFQSIFK